ncbi:HAD-IB family hydrolase [Aquincola sp. S2]|uniref:HAD-IB family hydrolase n=1 Tax=Pseudaquabacterium terrae TaxID=2732868 RepID=A0ABX2EKC7_9BURK|nr:HAD-IB family hydrolase [Aquabacterium terrae]
MTLTLFDLDHTLLEGDSDVLWCEFLMDQGVLDRAEFGARNAAMDHDYRAGTVGAQEFCEFYVSTLTARTVDEWQPLRRAFLDGVIAPRIKPAARALVQRHAEAGELLVMTTATNRFITELTAAHLGLPHLIATECERIGARFSGRTSGTLNMREGKVTRLNDWLAERQIRLAECNSTLYSDSINDLPLLLAVRHPVVVDPDPRLAAEAAERGWPVISLMA